MTIPEYPITREEMYLDAIARGEGGGGGVTVTPLSATENGTYTAPSGAAYSPVTVNVPTPTPTLTPKTITENGIYIPQDDGADGYDTVTVDVPGPDPSVQLVAEGDFVAPVATSSKQTITVSLDSTLVGLAPNVPFLALFEYTGQYPTAPEKLTAVKVYQLFSLHDNYQYYIYERGAWGVAIKTDGTIEYSGSQYSNGAKAIAMIAMAYVAGTNCHVTCKAIDSTYAYQPGNWHLKLFALQM